MFNVYETNFFASKVQQRKLICDLKVRPILGTSNIEIIETIEKSIICQMKNNTSFTFKTKSKTSLSEWFFFSI